MYIFIFTDVFKVSSVRVIKTQDLHLPVNFVQCKLCQTSSRCISGHIGPGVMALATNVGCLYSPNIQLR